MVLQLENVQLINLPISVEFFGSITGIGSNINLNLEIMQEFYEIKIKFPKAMDSVTARDELRNAVYNATIKFYEAIGEAGRLTDGKRLYGNGHHMAQNIAEQAGKLWDERLEDNCK